MVGVIYWSGTGNTEAMAQQVAAAIQAAGQEVTIKPVSEISADEAATFDKLALGCADMGSEQLEEYEFEPFIVDLESKLSGKTVCVFGSYGWGGTWLDDFSERLTAAGATVVGEKVAVFGTPDDNDPALAELGKTIAEA